MSITLGSLCKKILSNSFEETVLWLWTLKEKKVNKNKKDLSQFQWKSAHAPKKELPKDIL